MSNTVALSSAWERGYKCYKDLKITLWARLLLELHALTQATCLPLKYRRVPGNKTTNAVNNTTASPGVTHTPSLKPPIYEMASSAEKKATNAVIGL